MSVQVQYNLPGRERSSQKLVHRDDPVLPRSLAVRPVAALKHKPLVKSRLAMVTASKRAKKSKRLPSDETVFYSNIWSLPKTSRNKDTHDKSTQFVDISQVAHVLTTLDYKSGYEVPINTEFVNIWASLESQQNAKRSAWTSKSQQNASNPSTPISEHSSEENSSVVTPSSVLSLGPLKMNASSLRRELSSGDFNSIRKTPIAAPSQKGANMVFSNVLAHDGEVDMSWHSQFLLGMHEPVRHALFVIDRFLERSRAMNSVANWNACEFFSWFKVHFVEFVRNQHEVKSTVLLPLVVIKYGEKRDIIDFYEGIFALVDVIIGHEDGFLLLGASTAELWQTHLSILQDDIRHLNHLLLSVLALEEEAFKPALELAFTEEAFQRYVMPRIFRATKPKRVMVPWIVERSRVWGGVKVAKAYMDDLPFTARFLYDHVWHPYYEANIASAMKQLDKDPNDVAAKGFDESWLGCTLM